MKIGCDPEFIFRDKDGMQVYANTILQNGDFGMDGHSSTGEIRPKPAENSLQLVANIRKLLKEGFNHEEINELDMLAGHYKLGNPIGGHIHISGFEMNMPTLADKLVKVVMRLSTCIDNMDERKTRKDCGYGDREENGYRQQSNNWIEFRRPGSWLLSPQVAFLNLWLAEATCYAYINGQNEAFDKLDKHRSCNSLIKFAEHMKDVPNQDIFIQVADKTFCSLPLDWNVDLKGYWL